MSLTRVHCEVVLIKRLGNLLTAAKLDGTTVNGTNQDLNDPLGYALRKLGYSVTEVAAVADADVAQVQADEYDQLFDLAELRCLRSIHGNLARVDLTVGPRSEKYSQLADRVGDRISVLSQQVKDEYGIGAPELQAGTIMLDFVDKNEDLTDGQ